MFRRTTGIVKAYDVEHVGIIYEKARRRNSTESGSTAHTQKIKVEEVRILSIYICKIKI